MPQINESASWKALESHAEEMKATHLRDLMKDSARCNSLQASHDGILLDYSRQSITTETMNKLENLAIEADLDGKRAAMAKWFKD